ncbi:lactate dehydrogenase [Vibrio genomosp. F10]|uniref:Lactate dehydrogenase n=1 Tax=Vibrio genomosp. F10 str. ZF-129 TaxID=1187848 RepID=A0A1E5BCE4_9VIBR|nr:lactate dehydrogenase [Vibrio genomosp. F10]OEE32147.1 lactate dehydrogenase [Vibrio genomosp. F10 str. ZF-129]OEE93437.1 lactate dehydrogenase [Vibrio genomosp. F10 str. 9ZC157]OEF00232.1 lactate dehydrogenase [Vibrio genomosp. F10 str. 9ZD137]OEF04799.1 lactate dehydrogenase [Vibrio genomosp. F10 str. 9ZB36]
MSDGKLPKEAVGLQLNFCKTLACDNFGLSNAERYVLQHTNPKRPAMVCRECGAFPPLLNNQEVLNELQRLQHLHSEGLPACRNQDCDNFDLSVHTHKTLYHAFGYSGDRQRYRCKACQSTFVDKWSGGNKNLSFQENLLGLLFMSYSVREICRKLNINPKTFYDHVEHIASRCRRKLAMIDARWMKHSDSYQLASDYVALQPNSDNGVIWIATGEANTGYILCQHVNYSAQEQAEGSIDHDPYTTPARFVSKKHSSEANEAAINTNQPLRARIDQKYQTILARGNVEDPMGNLSHFNYPSKGALVRAPYTSYAHYLHILELCDDNKRLSVFMPQDPLLRSAALSVCVSRIKRQNVDLMYVEEDSNWKNIEHSQKVDIVHMGWWRDRWAIANQADSAKGICYLAGNKPDPTHWLQNASIHHTSFYQQRFQLLFASFINEPRRKLRPGGILPMLDIFRAWHNLCYQDKQGKTAAQNLGLSELPLTLRDLLS